MEVKILVVCSILGLATSFAVPISKEVGNGPNKAWKSSFAASVADSQISPFSAPVPISEEANMRNKRDLYENGIGRSQETIVVNRNFERGSTIGYEGQRDVHHHHHYSSTPPVEGPVYVENRWAPKQVPIQEYRPYQGGYNTGGYYSGGGAYYQNPRFVKGVYYPGTYSAPSAYLRQPPVVAAGPIGAEQNNVDRGQGAAAVNNIAIIHARAGSTSQSNTVPKQSTVEDDGINKD